jgi:hypothetical protein
MALVNVEVGSNTLGIGLPTELDIKRLLCALLAGDINNLMSGPLICINTHIDDLLGRLPSGVLADALRDLQYGIGDLLQQSGINDTLGRLNSATSQLESLFGLGGICPVPFTLPRIGNILGDMVAAYSAGARQIISDIANLEQALSHVCLGTGGIGANWNNMIGGSLYRLNQDINTFGGSQIPENVIGQYVAQFNQSKNAVAGIVDRMNGGAGNDAAAVATAAGLAFQLNGLYNKLGSYPVTDGNVVYDNVFKMFLDPDVYDALVGQTGGTTLITTTENVLDNCGRVVSTKEVVLQGDINTKPFDATLDAAVVPVPTPALGDFKVREESGQFKVNLLSGNNPVITLIKGRSYNIALETDTIGFNIVDPVTNQTYNEGLVHEDGTQGQYAQNKKIGYLTWNIPIDAPDELKYANVGGTETNRIVLQNVSAAGVPYITPPGGDTTNSFGKVIVSGQGTIESSIPGDTLTFAAGSNITFATDTVNKRVTISANTSTGNLGSIIVKDEGTLINAGATTLNFTGTGVIATSSGNVVTLQIDTGGGLNAFTNFTVGANVIQPDSTNDTLTFVAGSNVILDANTTTDTITISSIGGYAFSNIVVDDVIVEADTQGDTLTLVAGPGISLTADPLSDTITITNTGGGGGGGGNSFAIVAVPGQPSVIAETANDTLNIHAGTNVSITTNATTDTLTINASIPTFKNIVVGSNTVVADNDTDTLTLIEGNGITLVGDPVTDSITISSAVNTFSSITVSGGATAVADTANDTLTLIPGSGITLVADPVTDSITISSTAPNLFSTVAVAGQSNIVADGAGDTLTFAAGSAITLTTNATTDTLTVAISSNPTIPGNQFIRVPFGTTLQRPTTGADGQLRYNTTTTALEVFNTSWKSLIDEVVSVGTGTNIIKAVTDSKVELRSVKAGTGISIATDGNDITIASTVTDLTTGTNVGTGTGVFKEKVGDQLIFRSIKAGTGVAVTTDGNDITITAPRDQFVEAGTATTTTAAFTNVTWTNTLAPVTNSSWFFEATFIGRRTGGVVERNAFKIEGVVDNTAGTISLVGPAAKTTYQNNATQWDVDVSIVSNVLRFRVKGEASKTIKWTGWLRYQAVTEV